MLNPFQLTFDRPLKVNFLEIETNHKKGRIRSFKEYYEMLRKRFAHS